MPTPETVPQYTLQDLINVMAVDHRLAAEVLQKLPQLVTASSGDIEFNLGTVISVPSIAKMRAEMQVAGIDDLRTRLLISEKLVQAAIQEIIRMDKKQGENFISPYFKAIDLSNDNSDGRTTDPLWRAQVGDNLIHFPYEAFDEKAVDRKYDTQGAKLGGMLMPPYTENVSVEKRYSAAPAVANVVNVSAYPAFNRTITRTATAYYQYYYGYYYYWWYYAYGWAWGSYTYTYTQEINESLSGSSVAQTFQVSSARVLTGVDVEVLNPGGTKSAAVPKIYLCESSQGMPMMNKVLTSGTLVDNANAANTSTTATTTVQYAFTKPYMLQPGKSYSLVFVAANTWNIGYTSSPAQDATGGVFYTQDGQYWTSDLAKDLCYILRIADFGVNAPTYTIDMNALSLSGGIGSLNYKKSVQTPAGGGDVDVQIDINNNGNWSPLSAVANLQSLPTFCPLRAVFTGTQYAMPILDTQLSKIVAFRPSTNLKYISKDRTLSTGQSLTVSYSLYGFDNTDPSQPMHTFNPRLKLVDGPQTTITPTTLTQDRSNDGKVTKIKAVFTIPVGATTYRHDIVGTTLSANTLYDISGVLEM